MIEACRAIQERLDDPMIPLAAEQRSRLSRDLVAKNEELNRVLNPPLRVRGEAEHERSDRMTVQGAIQVAIRRLGEALPAAATHLKHVSKHRGGFAYSPQSPVPWVISRP